MFPRAPRGLHGTKVVAMGVQCLASYRCAGSRVTAGVAGAQLPPRSQSQRKWHLLSCEKSKKDARKAMPFYLLTVPNGRSCLCACSLFQNLGHLGRRMSIDLRKS